MDHIFNTLSYWFKEMLYWLMGLLASILELIPVPDWVDDADSLGHLSSDIAFYVAPMQLGEGIGIILTAYTIRFIIRRIPVIG